MNMERNQIIAQRTAFGEALCELGAEYENLVVLDPDVGPSTKTALFAKKYPERFFQTGIAEQNMAGIAAGLSTQGLIPFMSAFAVFMVHRAGDQIRNAIAHPRANVKINGGYAGLPTGGGATHSCVEDVAIMRALPNMTIFDPDATWKTKKVYNFTARELQVPVFKSGELVYKLPSLEEIRAYCLAQVDTLWDEVKRFDNPQTYYVDLSQKLWDIKYDLLKSNGR